MALVDEEGFALARALLEFVVITSNICSLTSRLLVRSSKNATSADNAHYSNFEDLTLTDYSIWLLTFDI